MRKCYRCFACNREKEAWFWRDHPGWFPHSPAPSDWKGLTTEWKLPPSVSPWLGVDGVWIPLCDEHLSYYRPVARAIPG